VSTTLAADVSDCYFVDGEGQFTGCPACRAKMYSNQKHMVRGWLCAEGCDVVGGAITQSCVCVCLLFVQFSLPVLTSLCFAPHPSLFPLRASFLPSPPRSRTYLIGLECAHYWDDQILQCEWCTVCGLLDQCAFGSID
jgi:hypothetical protein